MPPKKPKPRKKRTTKAGKAIPRAINRIAYAQKARLENSYSEARAMIMKRFGCSRVTAERDIAEVDQLIAEDAEKERPMLRVIETQRLQRVAKKAEAAGQFQSVASLSREVAKINGLHAPKKVEVKSTLSVSMKITSLVGVLDARGLAALELVQEQIESARQRGLLPVVTEEEDDEEDERREPEAQPS